MMHRGPASRRQSSKAWPAAALAAALLCAVAAGPARADFTDGVRAYEAGNYTEAYAQWLPLAEKNDVAAQRNIGHLYRWGQGVEKDIDKAMQWYRRAAELGFSRAQANLAAIYLQGEEGVTVNYDEAHKWFAAAAIQGHAVAQYNLGLMFELGLGIEKNEAKALGWYNLAAKSGQPEALERLSQLVKKSASPPLVSGVAVPAAGDPNTLDLSVPSATPVAASAAPPAADPAASAPVAGPALPAGYVPSTPTPAEAPAAAAAPAPAADSTATESAPVQPQPQAERPGFLSRFYNAISSGGGVSVPDIFDSGESKPAESGTKPAGSEAGGDSKP